MIGMALTMFYNLPFELIGFDFAGLLIIIATVLSVVSGCRYYFNTKEIMGNKFGTPSPIIFEVVNKRLGMSRTVNVRAK